MLQMLILNEVAKSYGANRAVDGVSAHIKRGAITGLIGPNGAGKTTLFNVLAGATALDSGSIMLDGRALGGLRADQVFAAGLARTFQIPKPFLEMTVLENVMLTPRHQVGESFWANWLRSGPVALQERQVREKAMHWLTFVGLDALAGAAARVLSGGQRKLLELARVMAAEPKIVLLDEPGAGVNPALLETIVDRIRLLHEQGVTFLIIEHNMDLVASLCNPVMVMAQGKLLASGTAGEVLRDPRVLEAYLGDSMDERLAAPA
jgi:branched-chain amino acid transport system ATP-binding protein